MIRSSRNLSVPEKKLIDAVRNLGFGEIYGASVPAEKQSEIDELSEPEWKLINYLRTGITHIDVLHVHAGAPAMGETDLVLNGFKSRKKFKFI